MYNQFVRQFGGICRCQFVGMWGQQSLNMINFECRLDVQFKKDSTIYLILAYLCVCLALGN